MNGPAILRSGAWRCSYPLVFAAILVLTVGCYRASREPGPEGVPPAATSAPSEKGTPEKEMQQTAEPVSPPLPSGGQASYEGPPPQVSEEPSSETVPAETRTATPSDSSPLPAGTASPAKDEAPAPPEEERKSAGRETGEPAGKPVAAALPQPGPAAPASPPDAEKRAVVVAMLPKELVFSQEGPSWARSKEELVYKVEFLGVTMGYARFSFLGKVLLSGKEAYHLRVRAWTSDILSLVYPIDDTIDYYLDVQTIVPLRQERMRTKKEDDVAVFDQEEGTIVYRNKKDGTVRKTVTVVPNVYDPVSLAYYFRGQDPEKQEKGRPMYAGRKLWEVSARVVGSERIRTDRGEFDTIIIEPELRREGKVDDGKDMRMWMTRDEHHVPVRVYAKFKKIRTWTLVGELLPDQQGG